MFVVAELFVKMLCLCEWGFGNFEALVLFMPSAMGLVMSFLSVMKGVPIDDVAEQI